MINPQLDDFAGLLAKTVRYEVPANQRPYQWRSQEIDDLLEDLESSKDALQPPYLGSFIFDVSTEAKGSYFIVDGQQRFTTLYILLLACRGQALHLGAQDLATTIQNEITFYERHSGRTLGPRLISSESIRTLLDFMASSMWPKLPAADQFPDRIDNQQVRRQVRKLQPIYKSFSRKLESQSLSQLEATLKSIYSIRITRIYIDNDEEAFSIFERTNARGMALEVSDLVQNFLFERKRPELYTSWKRITRNAEGGVLRMLKGFYTSQKGYVRKSGLYRAIKHYSGEVGGPEKLIAGLEEYSKFFHLFRNVEDDTDVKRYFESIGFTAISRDADKTTQCFVHLQGLRLFKIAQVIPLLYAGLQCIRRTSDQSSKSSAKEFLILGELLEKYHFVNNAICERVGNEVEKLYADVCARFALAPEFSGVMQELQKELRSRRAKRDEFTANFCDLGYGSSPKSLSLLAYIFDREANHGLKAGERVRLFRPDKDLFRRHYNIEHIFPQKPKSGAPLKPEALDSIGNLLLISVGSNSALQNDSPEEKIAALQGKLTAKVQNSVQIKNFLRDWGPRTSAWDSKAINERSESMAKDAYEKIWAF